MNSDHNTTRTSLRFLGIFFLMFFLTSVFLYGIDFVPEPKISVEKNTKETKSTSQEVVIETPTRIVIKDIGVDTTIENPTSAVLEVLDAALLAGAVRYPGSALLGEDAPIFLFGHQSYLPVVKNKAFKAFNDLQKLESGDTIQVFSDNAVYEYTVTSVSLVNADNALIPLEAGEKTLILSTCNSFGDPGERYVVTADYKTREPLL
ncbi:MAG: sortase [Patescibacteria group bacterium]